MFCYRSLAGGATTEMKLPGSTGLVRLVPVDQRLSG